MFYGVRTKLNSTSLKINNDELKLHQLFASESVAMQRGNTVRI